MSKKKNCTSLLHNAAYVLLKALLLPLLLLLLLLLPLWISSSGDAPSNTAEESSFLLNRSSVSPLVRVVLSSGASW